MVTKDRFTNSLSILQLEASHHHAGSLPFDHHGWSSHPITWPWPALGLHRVHTPSSSFLTHPGPQLDPTSPHNTSTSSQTPFLPSLPIELLSMHFTRLLEKRHHLRETYGPRLSQSLFVGFLTLHRRRSTEMTSLSCIQCWWDWKPIPSQRKTI